MKTLTSKNKPFSITILAYLLIIISSTVFAQDKATKIKSADWQLLQDHESVQVFYKYVDCNLPQEGTHKENVYLKIKNKTDKKLQVEWDAEYWYNEKCHGCEGVNPEFHKSIVVLPFETKEGTCSTSCINELRIFSKMFDIKTKQLTDFNIKDLKTTSIR